MPKAKIKIEKDHIEVETLQVVFFREGDTFIAHSPVLDLCACGETFEQAQNNMVETLDIFFTECSQRGTLEQALEACGWSVVVTDHKRTISPPVYVGQSRIPLNIPELV